MNFLPKPPTDNIYKFAALSGTWILVLIIMYYLFLGYLNINLEKESMQVRVLFSSQSMIEKIENRLLAIKEKRLEDSILSWTTFTDGSEQEISYLNKMKKIHEEKVKKYQPLVDERKFNGIAFLVFETGAHIVFIIFIPVGVLLVWQGYKQWYIKIQKPIDRQYKYDLMIKKITIKKLELELRNSQKKE